MATTKVVKYVVTGQQLHKQPAATKANPAAKDGIVKVSGTITKDGAAQKTQHKVILHRQMPEFTRSWKVSGNVGTFTLTETTAGRGNAKPTPKAEMDAVFAAYNPPTESAKGDAK